MAQSLLAQYLEAPDEISAQCFLDRLIEECALPILKGIVGVKYRVSLDSLRSKTQTRDEQEASDAYSDATIQLISYLRKLRQQPERDSIQNFRAYVAATTYRACDNLLRRKYPQRWSLKTKLRYLLSKQACFAIWEGRQHDSLCGFAIWRTQGTDKPFSRRLESLLAAPQVFAQQTLPGEHLPGISPARLLREIFDWLEHPMALDDLVTVVATLYNITETRFQEQRAEDEREGEDPVNQLADQGLSVVEQLELRTFLEQLWAEINALPVRQRIALLLNLRDMQNRGVIALLPLARIASIRQIAAALEMPAEQLAAIWKHLPYEDNAIAAMLQCTRMQVIGLRRCARDRLTRRLRSFTALE